MDTNIYTSIHVYAYIIIFISINYICVFINTQVVNNILNHKFLVFKDGYVGKFTAKKKVNAQPTQSHFSGLHLITGKVVVRTCGESKMKN